MFEMVVRVALAVVAQVKIFQIAQVVPQPPTKDFQVASVFHLALVVAAAEQLSLEIPMELVWVAMEESVTLPAQASSMPVVVAVEMAIQVQLLMLEVLVAADEVEVLTSLQ
jgi:hypothetical protein